MVWKDGKDTWEYREQDTSGGIDTLVESKMEVQLTINVERFTVAEQTTSSKLLPPYALFKGGSEWGCGSGPSGG